VGGAMVITAGVILQLPSRRRDVHLRSAAGG